jgi:hypothetical protein
MKRTSGWAAGVAAMLAPVAAIAAHSAWSGEGGPLLALAPLLLIPVICLIAGAAAGWPSGWYALMARFPDTGEAAVLKLSWRSGVMGRIWVRMGGLLTLEACASGLRVSILRAFAPFCRPFLVPWREIAASPVNVVFRPMVRLDMGEPPVGVLRIDARTWDVLSQAAQGSARGVVSTTPAITDARLAAHGLLQWAFGTGLAAAFLYFAPSALSHGAGRLPLAVCIALPGGLLGIATTIQFLIESRRT